MSTIYIAEDSSKNRVVAKILTAHGNHIAEKLSVKLKKQWEGEKAMTLFHPNIVKTFSCGKQKDNYFLIMEYLTGGSLAEHIRVKTADILNRRIEIAAAAANGLAYVHEKGIIHRDICPKNLIFDSKGTVKLIDFGVAIHKSDVLKPSEVRTGRPSYLAPELIRYNRFNVQTDIYAFGILLYEMFAGRRPYQSESRDELMNLHLRAGAPPPSKYEPSVSKAADELVMKAMAKEPQDRFVTMHELSNALLRLKSV